MIEKLSQLQAIILTILWLLVYGILIIVKPEFIWLVIKVGIVLTLVISWGMVFVTKFIQSYLTTLVSYFYLNQQQQTVKPEEEGEEKKE